MARIVNLTWEAPPMSTEHVPTREDIAFTLHELRNLTAQAQGAWAVVARPDRMARAEQMAERINSGREYGSGYQAVVRKLGAEIRVYARCTL